MNPLIVICAFALFAGSSPASIIPESGTNTPSTGQDGGSKEDYDAKREEAGKDPGKLWELSLWCAAFGMEKEAKSCARATVKYEEDHKEARGFLGHIFYEGEWFTTESKLKKHKAKEEERAAKAKGFVKHGDGWVSPEDLPFLKRGLVKDENGKWVDKETREKILAGWLKQDAEWVHPDEAEKIEAGLWKCGEEWLETEKANAYHAKFSSWWVIPDEVFVLHTTITRELADQALPQMHLALREVKRALGVAPTSPVNVALLKNSSQYGSFAGGNEVKGRAPMEASGKSSCHYAFMAETWIDPKLGIHMGAGVGYCEELTDSSFGPFSVRHAAAIGILEQLDPSPKFLEKLMKDPSKFNLADFYKEKRLSDWMRDGVCSYAERWLIDSTVKRGGNANWIREWSAQNIVAKGGMRPIKKLFTDKVDVNNPDSAKLLNERGMLIAFLIDGDVEELKGKHFELKQRFKKGESVESTIKDIEKLIIKHEQELRKFAGL
jgi:hypothetical protein